MVASTKTPLHRGAIMKIRNQAHSRLPVEDYSRAIRDAVSWLGDRYLLADRIDVRSSKHSPLRFPADQGGYHEFNSERH
jgi:hypothetical protein